MRKLSLKNTQEDTLVILSKIKKICEKLHLKYWGMYGTLIGAVRHNGFIPWDDDLDLAMPRKDYEIFLHYFKENDNQIDGLYIDNPLVNDESFFYISRVCDRDHLLEFDDRTYTSGLFVDIYPLDGMGTEKDRKNIKKYARTAALLRKKMDLNCRKSFLCGKSFPSKILHIPLVLSVKCTGIKHLFYELDELSQKYQWDDSEFVGVPYWAGNLRFLNKTWFSETIDLKFENTTLPAPIGYDQILREIYGDYMKLPPKNERQPQHDYSTYKL